MAQKSEWMRNGWSRFSLPPHLFSLSLVWVLQCDQIGRYLNVLGEMFLIKGGPNVRWIFGPKWKATILMLNYFGYFWATFGKIWFLFNLASGHSGVLPVFDIYNFRRSIEQSKAKPTRETKSSNKILFNFGFKNHHHHHRSAAGSVVNLAPINLATWVWLCQLV